MPSLLLHMTVVELLNHRTRLPLPPELARAFAENLEYARFGAALPDMPEFGGVFGIRRLLSPLAPPPLQAVLHSRAPIAMGLKMAELVALGALVGSGAGLAFVSGYFTHVWLDRTLHPMVDVLVEHYRRKGESVLAAHRRIEWTQAVLYIKQLSGAELLGTPAVRQKLQILKRQGAPRGGVGRGLYELVRVSSLEALDVAPTKAEVDAWVRGLYAHGAVLAGPLGRLFLPREEDGATRALLAGPHVDFKAEVDRALDEAAHLLERVHEYIRRGRFTRRARSRFMEEFPEGSVAPRAA